MENAKSLFEKLNYWIKNSITVKLFTIGFLILLLLIPSEMIQSLVYERQSINQEAIHEVSSKWGYEQNVSGPVLTVPYNVISKTYDNKEVFTTYYRHILPEQLNIKASVKNEIRYRGIHDVVVYNAEIKLTGGFGSIADYFTDVKPEHILWNDAYMELGVSDMRGIKENVKLNLNGSQYFFNPGIQKQDINTVGLSVATPIDGADTLMKNSFEIELALKGSNGIYFLPVGKTTQVNMQSDWPEPKFTGDFLPDSRNITNNGFEAKWKVLHLNRNYPQVWDGKVHEIAGTRLGVELIMPVDHYAKSNRAAKYAILTIVLTFIGYFFVEILRKVKVHPFQYILIGLSVCIFYLLLLAFSEHIGFNLAFVVSTLMVITAIALYTYAIFKNLRDSAVLSLVLLTLYGFVYVLIQLQDYALIMGSLGLFMILIVLMQLSKKINWYKE